jgi:hypothetical protein
LQHNPKQKPESGTGTSAPKKRPPLAKAARSFLKGVEFPPVPHNGRGQNQNVDVALLFALLLHYATGLKEGDQTAKCSPALSELAETMHCSASTVQRRLRQAEKMGLLTRLRRGDDLSSLCTLYQKSFRTGQHVDRSENISDRSAPESQVTDELRNDKTGETSDPEEDAELRNGVDGDSDRSTVDQSPVTDPKNFGQVNFPVRTGQLPISDRSTSPFGQVNMLTTFGGVPSLEKELFGVVCGASPATPASPATEVGSSVKTGEWSDPLRATATAPADSSGKSGLLIQATKKPDLPECQICQQLAGHLSAAIIPDPKGKFCERHDNENYR